MTHFYYNKLNYKLNYHHPYEKALYFDHEYPKEEFPYNLTFQISRNSLNNNLTTLQGRIQAAWETRIPVCAPNFWCPQNIVQVLFSILFQQKVCWSGDQWLHNASYYFEMA